MTSSTARTIALATFEGLPSLDPDEHGVFEELRAAGHTVEPAVWSEPRDWDRYDLVVLRSCWDYDTRPEEFLRWIDHLESVNAKVVNPTRAIRWNFDKAAYLTELADAGIPIVPTEIVTADELRSATDILAEFGWSDAVVKPAVSMSANSTWRVSTSDQPDVDFKAALRAAPLLVQKFQPEIVTEGEWSFIYFEGLLQYTVRKTPASGDFRVQSEYGGGKEQVDPPAALARQADQALRATEACCGSPIPYARVDGVRADSTFLLMEMEIIDPSLYFEQAPGSAERFAQMLSRYAAAGEKP